MLRTGIDLVEINRLENLRPEIRERFLQRVFTPGELQDAHGSLQMLSGRFAAKEAVAKVLQTGIGPIGWQDIEIRKGTAGEPILTLHGAAQKLAKDLGLVDWSVSISHTRQYAVACVVALGKDRENRK